MARFSVDGSDGEEDNATDNKRPVSRTFTNSGYVDYIEEGSSDDELLARRGSSTKKPRFSIIVEETLEEGEESMEEAENSSSEEREREGQVSVILLDPDVLDCPICFEPLTLPVFQCENGHIACAPCCTKMSNKCGNCSLPIGYNRCRAIEKVVESVKISCRNVKYGCKETIRYGRKLDHDKACLYQPCSCPLLTCDYVASCEGLYRHFGLEHSKISKQFTFSVTVPISFDGNRTRIFLQEKTGGTLFIINRRCIDHLGSLFNVVCVGPTSTPKRYYYSITSKGEDSSLKLESVADTVPDWLDPHPVKKGLLVPNEFIPSTGKIKLEVNISS